jgi:hypothetical protein
MLGGVCLVKNILSFTVCFQGKKLLSNFRKGAHKSGDLLDLHVVSLVGDVANFNTLSNRPKPFVVRTIQAFLLRARLCTVKTFYTRWMHLDRISPEVRKIIE